MYKGDTISKREKQTILSCPPKDINKHDINSFLKKTYYDNGYSEVSKDDITRIKESINREKSDYNEVFDKIIPKISVEMIISFTTVNRTNSRQTLFTLISNYELEQQKIKERLEKAQLPADYGSGGNSERCISSASGQGSPAPSPPGSPRALPPASPPASPTGGKSSFNRKSRRKLLKKSARKSVRKPLKKSARKSVRKPLKKSPRKSVRKPLKKSPHKPLRKSVRKSIRKSIRKPLKKSKRKSRR